MKINMSAISKEGRKIGAVSFTRRGFLKVIGAGAAAGITSPILPALARKAVRKKWRMKLSTSSIHFMQLPIEQACERIAKLGFEEIGRAHV